MKRISLFLSDRQVDAFRRLADDLDRPAAELIREALDEFLRRRGPAAAHKAERPRAATRKRS